MSQISSETHVEARSLTVRALVQVFKLLADESRLKILLALGRGELHVTALCDLLGQTNPAVSHHLTLLRMAKLVSYRRDGKRNYYRIESCLVGELLERFFAETGKSKQLPQVRARARTANAQVFKLLADESRLKILMALGGGELHVTALCGLLGQSQPAVSHHLTLLRMAKLVGYRRDGKHNYYRIESRLVGELLEHFAETDEG
jgi:ArsR family transcriptional regulator